ncbi:exported hypothetical protein [Candidatus Zixiibacteriota bacterium]|nr:exported hypothetical protein [candidate division Zixibacteria bacterium]
MLIRLISKALLVLAALYLALLIPLASPPEPAAGTRNPFAWNQDQYWSALEREFRAARAAGCDRVDSDSHNIFNEFDTILDSLAYREYQPDEPIFKSLETSFFTMAPQVGACHELLPGYLQRFNRMRSLLKAQSHEWDINSEEAKNRLYRLIYGGRIATEEVMLQMPKDSVPALTIADSVASVTPSAEILGVTIHSGDILVSRGGAATSALIARGNDYPGNFSHVALVYVDDSSGEASVIESHIEKGVAIASLDQYLKDTKLRVMVLRLRPDLPTMQKDPMLPHKAAKWMLAKARARHIPYDFEMNFDDTTEFFCSEVASRAYRQFGINLWMGLSHISSRGVKSWLGAFGVTHFETQEPSDLEYDPQLSVVAEWRDPETLYKDHIDNAVIDVMLEGAERGERLKYDWYLLPMARVMKAYSAVLNMFGKIGPVPEGMSATAALRNKWFTTRHTRIKERLLTLAEQFKTDNKYVPPYWELVNLARKAEQMEFGN